MISVMLKALILTVLIPGPAMAACPAAPDIERGIDRLVAQARAAPDERAARVISGRMWAYWTDAPDDRAQELLDEGMQRRESYDFDGAILAFDALVDYCPAYAEGYNQRAFANFLREDFAAALPDLDKAVELQPRHIPAISGKGLTLIRMGRIREGQVEIRRALELNPWLGERAYLTLRPESVDL